jgi:hypothetical protein
MLDRALAAVEELEPYRKHPVFKHFHELGYRMLWHLAAILGTRHTHDLLKEVGLLDFPLIPTTEECLAKHCKAGSIDLRGGDGPEFPQMFSRPRAAAGWVSDHSEPISPKVGQPVPTVVRRPVPLPPPTDSDPPAAPHAYTLPIGGPVGDQGSRGTCVAFAVAVLYYAASQKAGRVPCTLSTQYLYAWAKQDVAALTINGQRVDLRAREGTTFEAVLNSLSTRGACLEDDLAYEGEHDLSQFYTIRPPVLTHDEIALENRASEHCIKSYRSVELTSNSVRRELYNKRAVAVGLPLYQIAWGNPVTYTTGVVPMPLTIDSGGTGVLLDVYRGGHAVAIIGYRDDATQPGGGAFLFRNCWGREWANDHAQRRGLGWLPYAYLERYAEVAYVIDELL